MAPAKGVQDHDGGRRRVSGFAGLLLGLLGVALILAAFRVDTPMLIGGNPAAWRGGVHGIVFLLIIAMGVLAPLTMALAVRGDPGWRPITVMSLAASALFVVFLILPSLSPGRIRPDLYARTTACARLYRSSFAKILLDYLGRLGSGSSANWGLATGASVERHRVT